MNVKDSTAREFTNLVLDCNAVGVDVSDIANCTLPLIKAGNLSDAVAAAHIQVLRHRLWGAS